MATLLYYVCVCACVHECVCTLLIVSQQGPESEREGEGVRERLERKERGIDRAGSLETSVNALRSDMLVSITPSRYNVHVRTCMYVIIYMYVHVHLYTHKCITYTL